jgi:hypothetical protein
MGITRFKDARADKDGPVSGAIIVIPVVFDDIANSETAHWSWAPPAGMEITLVAINVQANAITNDPKITVGTAKAGTEVVASVTVATALGELTLKSSVVTSGDVLDVRVVADGDDVAESVSATITAYVSKPPTSLLTRGDQGHF